MSPNAPASRRRGLRPARVLGLLAATLLAVAPVRAGDVAASLKACDGGDMDACTDVGIAWQRGDGVAADAGKAAGYYQRSCDGGDGDGCNNLGNLLSDRKSLPVDYPRAKALYDRGCTLQSGASCGNLGWTYLSGEGSPVDELAARAHYGRACELGNAHGCVSAGALSFRIRDGDSASRLMNSQHYSEKAYWDRACRLGNDDGCERARKFVRPASFAPVWAPADIGKRFMGCIDGSARDCQTVATVLEGEQYVDAIDLSRMKEVPRKVQDFPTARLLYRRACDLGLPAGCNDLGADFEFGHQVPVSLAQARALYIEACDLGYGPACTNMAGMFEQGRGTGVDLRTAGLYFHKGCDTGSRRGCEVVKRLWPNPADNPWLPKTEPLRALRKGCIEAGRAGDCRQLADAYQSGKGAPNDSFLAAGYEALACEGGEIGACAGVAQRLERGDGVWKNLLRARDYYEKSCNSGLAAACASQARLAKVAAGG